MRTYWSAHGLGGARPRGSRRDQRQGGRRAVPHAHARAETGSAVRARLRHADRSRCIGPIRSTARSPTFRWRARSSPSSPASRPGVHAERPFDVILFPLSRALRGRGPSRRQMTGVPHVVRTAGSDAGRLWRHPQLEALYDHVLKSAEAVICGGAVAGDRGLAGRRSRAYRVRRRDRRSGGSLLAARAGARSRRPARRGRARIPTCAT